ncbi:MAG TPA: methyltransferase domain-containing protein, partial [Acidobacteriota bacterium]|nr:methyltransferase domain-containing protein [Acidobacteriota bacterium]
ATEIDGDLVSVIREKAKSRGLTNLSAVMGTRTDSGLDEGCCDAVVLRMVYHQFDHPEEMMADIYRSLRPGGLLAVVEWDRSSFGPHGYGPEGLAERLARSGFEEVEVVKGWIGNAPQYCAVFKRP